MKRSSRGVRWCLASLLLSSSACAELTDYPTGVCGNAILENDGGALLEQCDTHVEAGQSCGAPDSAAPCRFGCGVRPDAAEEGERFSCPAGFACGADDICRKASGEYQLQSADFAFIRGHALGDVNGDGADDVVSAGLARVGVASFEADGSPLGEQVLGGGPQSVPRLLRIDGPTDSGLDPLDAVYPLRDGIVVAKGSAAGLQPESFASIRIGRPPPALFFSVPGTVLPTFDLSYAFGILRNDTGFGLYIVDPLDTDGTDRGLLELARTLPEEMGLPRRVLPANFDARTPSCHEAVIVSQTQAPAAFDEVFSHPSEGSLWVWAPCAGGDLLVEPALPPRRISLEGDDGAPPPIPVGDPAVVDVDENGTLDIVTQVNVCGDDPGACPNLGEWNGCCFIYVAYGLADELEDGTLVQNGRFASSADGVGVADLAVPLREAAQLFGEDGVLYGVHPIAWGDFNADGRADFVDPYGVAERLSPELEALTGLSFVFVADTNGQLAWKSVVVADFDLDGVDDVVASPLLTPALAYLRGTRGGSMGFATIQLDLPMGDLVGGDFDGDGRPDVAGRGISSDAEREELQVLYGDGSAFTEPVVAGAFPGGQVQQVAPGRLTNPFDAADDLAAVLVDPAAPDALSIALFRGTADRQPVAPITLVGDQGSILVIDEVVAYRPRLDGDRPATRLLAFARDPREGTANGRFYGIDLSATGQLVGVPSPVDALSPSSLSSLVGGADPLASQVSAQGVDLDLDGLDELVLTVPFCSTPDCTVYRTRLVVLGADDAIRAQVDLDGAALRRPFDEDNPARPTFFAAGDADGDGDPDLAFVVLLVEAGRTAAVLVENTSAPGAPALGAATTLPSYPGPDACRAEGSTEDAVLGVAIARGPRGAAQLLVGGGRGLYRTALDEDLLTTCPQPVTSVAPELVLGVVVGDVNADGVEDLVLNRLFTEVHLGIESREPPEESP